MTKAENLIARAKRIAFARAQGKTLRDIAEAEGLSLERVRQILLGEPYRAYHRNYVRQHYVSRRR